MTVKKLSDSDKSEILNLYRTTGETTSTLAERYGVSNSTISRLLKSTLPEDEYEALIGTKRAARTLVAEARQALLFGDPDPHVAATVPHVETETEREVALALPDVEIEPNEEVALALPDVEIEPNEEVAAALPDVEIEPREVAAALADLEVEPSPETGEPYTLVSKRLRRRSSAASKPEETPARVEAQLNPDDAPRVIALSSSSPLNADAGRKPVPPPQLVDRTSPLVDSSPSSYEDSRAEASALASMLGEDLLLDDSEDLTDLDDEDDEDLEDLDEDDLDQEMPILPRRVRSGTLVQVLPLSEATLPKTCYLVIDRASELITRPLRDFGDLGQIPSQENQQKTLPVFDNHRVARRFSTKRDRVIKVPDSRMLQKACSHLQAKGITRLLVDGQVYSLSSN